MDFCIPGTIKQLAQAGGIKNYYFVEMDLEMMKASVPYLRDLQV